VAESLLPTLHLLEACRDAGSGRIIFASSGGTVYGLTDPQPVDERHPTEPITAYGINKLACEKYLAMYNRLYQLDTLSLRIANPFGPYQNRERAQGVVGAMLWRALAGEPIRIFGDGTVTRDYIFVGDVVAALLAAAEYRGQGRLFNIGSGRGRTLREVAASVRALAGSGAAPILYEEGRAADVPYNVLDSSAFTAATGWAAKVEWQEGLAATAAWIREEMRRPSSQAAPERYFSSVP
jgi:UDP-glucose 4-epimerase